MIIQTINIMSNITKKPINELNEDEKENLFMMYKNSYGNAGQPLWFKDKNELFSRYPCIVTLNNDYSTIYALFQFKTKFNKISLVCHNGTDDGKRKSVELRYMLISQPGWILEASGASSWMLRKKNAPYFKDKDAIETALDIIDNPNDKIIINDSFDYNNKESHHYIRVYRDINNDKEYRSEETLFGTASCNYKTNDCARTCEEEVKVGGKPKRRSKKSRTRKKR
jgi:hypothetical protein